MMSLYPRAPSQESSGQVTGWPFCLTILTWNSDRFFEEFLHLQYIHNVISAEFSLTRSSQRTRAVYLVIEGVVI